MTYESTPLVLRLHDIGLEHSAIVGGKGAHLAVLSRIEGLGVPPGFCVTTNVFERVVAASPLVDGPLTALAHVTLDDRAAIHTVSAEVRRAVEGLAIPDDVAAPITASLDEFGAHAAYAVRSSATAEDLPTASFAGQYDTYLNVLGRAAILQTLRRCWASLYTERAVTYRLQRRVDHRTIRMAVVVQRMVIPQVSGVVFTADPITGHRGVAVVEACVGLGDALVSGKVGVDAYRVRDGEVIAKTIAKKRLAIAPAPTGGTREQPVDACEQEMPALNDAQVVRIAGLGRRVEAHFERPQDIEWCLVDDRFHIVQSRPITTLFPIPATGDQTLHVYVSVGHQQMMTDPISPLGLSVWQLTTPRPMAEAGGRLFVDVTPMLASPASRPGLVAMLGRSDPLIGEALQTILDRGDIVSSPPDAAPAWTPPGAGAAALATDPTIVPELIARSEASLAELKREIATKSGPAVLDFILQDIRAKRGVQSDPRSLQVVMAGMEASWWLNDQLWAWLGEKNAADALTQSVPHNVTSEMGLALLDVADVIRPHRDVVERLREVSDDAFLDALPEHSGGPESRAAIRAWLDTYGMRGIGEIDITRPRWSERPAMLVPILLGHIEHAEPGAREGRFERGRQQARKKEDEVLERLRALPDGDAKAAETKRMIDRVRTFAGYREYPKFAMVNRYFVYKQALMREADRLVQAGVLSHREDIFFFRFEELQVVARTHTVDGRLVDERRAALRSYHGLTPPRVLTSQGEIVTGAYRRERVPACALVGLPVSSGTVEGRARVILDIADAALEPGDILVTAYTDPSWTSLFVAIAGLVTEVGGLMTHGAVIAREYGVPAVVGVEHATRLIQDRQRIRVHGTDGYVEVLP